MKILLTVFGIIIVILVAYIIWIFINLRHLSEDLKFINQESTQKELTIGIHHKIFKTLVYEINYLIKNNKIINTKFEQRHKSLQSSISNIIHDVRTPLTVASGYIQMVDDNTLDSQSKDLLQYSYEKLNQVSLSLESLYFLNQLEEKQELDLEVIELSEFINNAIIQDFDAFESKGLTLSLNTQKQVYIEFDRNNLITLFDNLISNILHYGKSQATLDLYTDSDFVILAFTNDKETSFIDVDKVYDRFYYASSNGTGLGLHIAKTIMDNNSSIIEVLSNDTEFRTVLKFNKTL